jgi:hypothetical protein
MQYKLTRGKEVKTTSELAYLCSILTLCNYNKMLNGNLAHISVNFADTLECGL